MASRDLAIDMGTANTSVYQQGRGIVYDEPTVVGMNARTGEVLAVGNEVAAMVDARPGGVVSARPLSHGVVTDYEATEQMLRLILRRVGIGRFGKTRVLVCVPTSITGVERRAVEEAVTEAGARGVTPVESPLAAAIGAGLPIQEPIGNMIVDVGGGTSEIALVAMGGVVVGSSVRVGGFDMDTAIQEHIRARYGLGIGEAMAERLKTTLGSAYPAADARPVEVPGRAMSSAVPTSVQITPEEIREALRPHVQAIVDATRSCLAESPPELAHDVLEHGIFLTGGGALLRGLEMRLSQECEVPVHLTERPMTTVVLGAGRLVEYLPDYQTAFVSARRWS